VTRPEIQVLLALGQNAFAADSSLTWTDVSADVLLDPSQGGAPITITRGRQGELGRVEAGRYTFTLNNAARAYDPTYTSSPYYPNIRPMTRCRIRARWPVGSGTWYNRITGYVEAWTPAYPGPRQAVVHVRGSDAFTTLARAQSSVTSGAPGETSHNAIRTALNIIGWAYATDYVYANGSTTIAAGSYLNLNALQYMQTITDTENGLFFVGPQGFPTFQDRHYRINNATSVGIFGNAGGSELPYLDVAFSYDEALLYNDIRVTRAGGALQEAVDSASQTTYGPRVLTISGLYMATDDEALGLAQWLLVRYGNPSLRVTSIVLNGELNASTLWPIILARELSDKIEVKVRPPGGGTIDQLARIEAVADTISLEAWLTTWQLSLAGEDQYWVLGSATQSFLDSTTRLSF